MKQRFITPSKVTAWLDCPHYLKLRTQVDDGQLSEPDTVFGSFSRLLQAKGEFHEAECLEDYQTSGLSIYKVPSRQERETFASWVARVGNPLADGYDVIYQMPFIHDGVRGIADFIERGNRADGGFAYEPVDAKLTRVDAKPGHVLQLCFYADAIAALSGQDPERIHILLGSGRRETLKVNEFRPYWRRLRGQLAAALDAGPEAATAPEKCSHCAFCEFFPRCEAEWREQDSLIFIPGIRPKERSALAIADVTRIEQLGWLVDVPIGIRGPRLGWLVEQARLQVQARLDGADDAPPFSIVEAGDDANLGRGFELMPEPDPGDVFLDFEGHPFWRPDTGLFFLLGLIERDSAGEWVYRSWWAHDREQEAQRVAELVDYLTQRRAQFPSMHAYHYNHTERTALQSLTREHGVAEAELGRLVQAGVFVDLFAVARNSIQVGAESYGLKSLERLTDYQRSHDIDKGAGAVVRYEQFMADGSPSELVAIAAYNEDDVRATRALRDWLVAHRPDGLPWRQPPEEPSEVLVNIDDQIAAFHQFEEGTPEHLLGDLLGYWTNEWWAYLMPKLAQCQQDTSDLLEVRDAIADMRFSGPYPRFGKKGTEIAPGMGFTFPPQQLEGFPDIAEDDDEDTTVMYVDPDGSWLPAKIERLDRDAGQLGMQWGKKNQEAGHLPTVVLLHPWVRTEPKRLALSDFGARLLESNSPNRVTEALLRRELPRFRTGHGPSSGVFSDELADMMAWAPYLDHSYVAVQGPPGTGKTHRAAHIVHALVTAGQRVGITAFSHRAIENVVAAVSEVFAKHGDIDVLRGVRVKDGATRVYPGFTNVDGPKGAIGNDFTVFAGSTWLFTNDKIRDEPVDVLLIDEAGQLALADALAASTAAHNLILLGDPLQLPQVTQANHRGGGGLSALDHILDKDVTLPAERGVFIPETWRMHPDICDFISEEIYEGRLHSHPDCRNQTTNAGTGLRWLKADHHGNSTSSTEEADMVARVIAELMGTPWTNFKGEVNPLKPDDFMVLAPYNDQVRTIRRLLDSDPLTAGVPVGTVDKFQGGQAAVVLFSMATSTSAEMVRSADFLFSRNRLNVAISRARCLAYLICTEELLNTRARSVEEMRLIATLNAFVEWAS
jgi:predicted RecB family nuclease